MFTQFPSPLRRATACRSHGDQVTLRITFHELCGPGATPHRHVLLSDWFRDTLLTKESRLSSRIESFGQKSKYILRTRLLDL